MTDVICPLFIVSPCGTPTIELAAGVSMFDSMLLLASRLDLVMGSITGCS
jgi:hypothetical protein